MIPPRSVMFGTEGKMSWIKAPAINVGMSKGKWTSSGVMLNGGAYELGSNYAHRKFDFAWNLMSPEEVRKITRYFDGVYGDELLYYLDPFAMNSNVLPLSWSVPMLAADDAPPLVLDQVPTLSTVATNTNDLPVRAATYTLSAGYVSDTVFIPVPDGEGLNIGVVGSRTGTAAVTFTPKTGSAVSPTLTGIGSTNLITNYMTNTGGGVTVSLTGLGTITLVAMQARVSPNEISAPFVTTNLFTNPSFETPVNRPKLSAWRTAFNTGSVQIVAIGDSITEGTGASTVTNRWQTILQTALRGGVTGATFPFIPAWPQSSVPGFPVTRSGTVGQTSTSTGNGLGWRGADLRDDTAMITFTFIGDRFKAMVFASSGSGVMSVQIDGGTPILVNTQPPAMTGGNQTWDSGALTNGAHTVVIRRSSTSPTGNFVYLQGLLTYNGDFTSGVRVLDAARHGINSTFVTSARATGLGSSLTAAGGAKLAIIGLGTNDYPATTPSDFKANIEILIAGLRSTGFTGSILLLGMYLGGGRDNATWSTYLDQYAAIAAADANIDYLDLRTVMPAVPTPFDDPSGQGLYADALHPNNAGYARIRSAIMPYLVDGVSGITGGYRTTEWAADSTHSLRVESEQTATVSVTGPVVITARNAGQSATLAGTTVNSTSANQTLTLTGSGTLTLGAGWWDKLGDGITSWFSGSTPSTGDTTYAWTGTVNASTSTKTTSVPSPNAKQGFISGEGHSGLRLSGVANISGYSAPSALNLQSISATLTEVGAWEPR